MSSLPTACMRCREKRAPICRACAGLFPKRKSRFLNVMKAIEQGIITETTKARLEELEAEQKKLEGEIGAEQLRHPRMSRDEIVFGIERFAALDVTTHEGRQK